jgi:hypothetical protein
VSIAKAQAPAYVAVLGPLLALALLIWWLIH